MSNLFIAYNGINMEIKQLYVIDEKTNRAVLGSVYFNLQNFNLYVHDYKAVNKVRRRIN